MIFNCIEQIGGYKNVRFYTLDETTNWPSVLNDANSEQIEFNSNEVAVDAILEPDSIRVSDEPKAKDPGELYEIDIEFVFNMQSEALEKLLDQYKNYFGVCEVCKIYGQRKLYGANRYPLRMTYSTENGRRPEDGQKTIVKITGNAPKRAVYLNN